MAPEASDPPYNRAEEVRQFDESKIGVKGLVDSGITTIPRFFIHPTETLADLESRSDSISIPTVDLSGRRSTVVAEIRHAASEFGFFQIINHGMPQTVLDGVIEGVRSFHEQSTVAKSPFYRRDMSRSVAYSTNIDLYQSKAASWRDTIQIRLGPGDLDFGEVPAVCRTAVMEWDQQIERLGEVLMELVCEGLGVEKEKLKKLSCLEGRLMVGHYYPYCPESDRTVGLAGHSDPGVLTVLNQDGVGGLQVKCGEGWVDVKPVPGALVINVGDILQILSNEEYKSVEHRVVANSTREPRVSVAVFFNPSNRDSLFGPLSELITSEKPTRYRQFTISDYFKRYLTKELGGRTLTDFYRL